LDWLWSVSYACKVWGPVLLLCLLCGLIGSDDAIEPWSPSLAHKGLLCDKLHVHRGGLERDACDAVNLHLAVAHRLPMLTIQKESVPWTLVQLPKHLLSNTTRV